MLLAIPFWLYCSLCAVLGVLALIGLCAVLIGVAVFASVRHDRNHN